MCSKSRIGSDNIYKELENLVTNLRALRDVCNRIQETPESMREELYGVVYDVVRRTMEKLRDIYEELVRIHRIHIASLTGLAIAMTLLAISIILVSVDNFYVFMAAITAGFLSVASIAIANSSLRIAIATFIVSGVILLLCGMQIGDGIKAAASIIAIAISIITSHRVLQGSRSL
jgi:VIT1/CCC1 family predicted Fe2+/Mn2+ transporter